MKRLVGIGNVDLRSATSSSAQHSAANAVDGNAQSYWASGFDPSSAVDMILDFGATKKIEKVEIAWEYPPLVSLQDFSRSATDLYEHVSLKPSCVL